MTTDDTTTTTTTTTTDAAKARARRMVPVRSREFAAERVADALAAIRRRCDDVEGAAGAGFAGKFARTMAGDVADLAEALAELKAWTEAGAMM